VLHPGSLVEIDATTRAAAPTTSTKNGEPAPAGHAVQDGLHD
jgi:hypothetical protein